MYNNATIIYLKLLINIGIKEVNIADFVGLSSIPIKNSVSNNIINFVKGNEYDVLNKIMSKVLKEFSKNMKFNFLTRNIKEIL